MALFSPAPPALTGRLRSFLKRALHSMPGRARRLLGHLPRVESLKLKLILGSSALTAVILLITYSTLSHTARIAAHRAAQKQVTALSSYFSRAIAEPVAVNDPIQVHLLARSLLDNGVRALLVTSVNGEILFPSRREVARNAIYSTVDSRSAGQPMHDTVHANGKAFIHTVRTVRFGETPVGTLHLWLDRTELEERILEANAFTYPILGFGFLLMALLGLGVLNTPFRALKRMTQLAERIGSGDLSVRVPLKGNDEVAEFSKAFNAMVDGLSQARAEVHRKHLETIRAMIGAVEAKDSYTQGHCIRVQRYVRQILERVSYLSSEEKSLIETAALLHDIGKIGIPDRILLKTGQLSKKEVEIVRSHVTIGENLLLHLDSMKESAIWVRHHHERWDGLGYPDGLNAEAIPFASRVIAVADSVDAMLTDRPYRSGLSYEEAIRALNGGRESQFDPEIVDYAVALLETMESKVSLEAL